MSDDTAATLWSSLGAFLFLAETYHFVTHCFILFRVRLLPRKDLVRVRYYFLVDTMTVAVTSHVFLQRLQWLAVLQMFQHLYHWHTWETSWLTKKVVSWSSLDWQRFECRRGWEWDVMLGTMFDAACHAVYAGLLFHTLSWPQILVSLALCQAMLWWVLYNPRFAWSSPRSFPDWVSRRLAKDFSHLKWH